MSEQVLVFPKECLTGYLDFQGALKYDKGGTDFSAININLFSSSRYMQRSEAEVNPDWKQVICYAVLTKSQDILAYQRTKKGGENRLHNLWSIGVGGHISKSQDGNLDTNNSNFLEIYYRGLDREIQEETGLAPGEFSTNAPLGFLYDPSNDVGKVHFGIVHLVDVKANVEIKPADGALTNFQWLAPRKLRDTELNFENWSKLVIERLL